MENEGKTTQEMKYCKHCGERIPAKAIICTHCGCQVEELHGDKTPQIIVNNANSSVNQNVTQNVNQAGNADYPYKSRWAAFFLCLFLGYLGVHRFYVGKTGTGVLWLFTVGMFGIGWLVDLLMLLFGGFRDKAGYPLR